MNEGKKTKKDKEDTWTFFTNHGHVYFLIARKGNLVMREIAQEVGITERAVRAVIDDLEKSGYIQKEKVGRANIYKPVPNKYLRHPLEEAVSIDSLLKLMRRAIRSSR